MSDVYYIVLESGLYMMIFMVCCYIEKRSWLLAMASDVPEMALDRVDM